MFWDNKEDIFKKMEAERLLELKNQLSINGYCFESFLYRNGFTTNYKLLKDRFLKNKNFDLKGLDRSFTDFIKRVKKRLDSIRK